MERDLLGKFKDNLQEKFDFKATKNIKHVDEIDKTEVSGDMNVDFLHKIHPDSVKVNDKYTDNYNLQAGQRPKVTMSDPYNEIFQGNYAG